MRVIPGRLSRIVRRFLRAPSFATIAVLTLALGIGANTAIFSVIRGVLLKPLPFAEPDSLIAVWHTAPGLNLENLELSPATYFTYREEGRVFEDIGLWTTPAVSVTGTGEPERVQALVVTDGLLGVLRVAPQIGRLFTREDDLPRTPERVILTNGYWHAEVRPGSVRDRPADCRGRDSPRDHRRAAGGLPLPRRAAAARPAAPNRSRHHPRRRLQLPGDRAAQARRDDRPGQRRHRTHDSAARRALSAAGRLHQEDVRGSQDGPERQAAGRRRDRRRRARALGAARDRRDRAADRVRQRRQPLPRPRGRPAAGARDPCRARRKLAARGVGAPLGEPRARPRRRRLGRAARRGGLSAGWCRWRPRVCRAFTTSRSIRPCCFSRSWCRLSPGSSSASFRSRSTRRRTSPAR